MCRIGREDNCKITGCQWHKVFGHYCTEVGKCENDVKQFGDRYKTLMPKAEVKLRPTEDSRPFYTRKKKLITYKRTCADTVHSVKKETPENKPVKELDLTKIKTAVQDDWIKKIKVIKDDKKF